MFDFDPRRISDYVPFSYVEGQSSRGTIIGTVQLLIPELGPRKGRTSKLIPSESERRIYGNSYFSEGRMTYFQDGTGKISYGKFGVNASKEELIRLLTAGHGFLNNVPRKQEPLVVLSATMKKDPIDSLQIIQIVFDLAVEDSTCMRIGQALERIFDAV